MATLVTGATGFIGSHIAKKLVDRGEHVKILRELLLLEIVPSIDETSLNNFNL